MKWYAKLAAMVLLVALAAGLVVGCGGTETVTTTQTTTQTVTQTVGGGVGVTVTQTAAPQTITQTVTKTATGTAPVSPAPGGKRETIKLRIVAGHPYQSALWVQYMQDFFVPELKSRVLERTTNYQVEVDELYGGTLAKLGEELEAIESGLADMGLPMQVFDMAKLYPHGFPWWLPFGTANLQQVIKIALKTYEQFPILDEILTGYNQKRLALVGLGSYHLNTTFPVKTLEDVKGKKLAHGGTMVPWLTALGAVGVQSRLNEAYTSLQTGVYDGWAMEPVSVVGFKMYEPAPYYTICNLGAGIPALLTINLDTWKKLPKEVQDIIAELSKEYETKQAAASTAQHDSSIGVMAMLGVNVSKLSDSERMRFAKAMNDANVADVAAKEADAKGWHGSEIASFYIKALADDGYKWPIVPTIK